MSDMELSQLSEQQALQVEGLKHMLEGNWSSGANTLEGVLLALNPALAPLSPVEYKLQSDGPATPQDSWWFSYDPETLMPTQRDNWSCAACALAWIERATGIDSMATEMSAVAQIGFPQNINPTYGLMDGSGARLQQVLSDVYGVGSEQSWLTFNDAYTIFAETTGMISGGAWYHWVAVRGLQNGSLLVANSAPGYLGVGSVLTREMYQKLGPFSCVALIR